MRKGPIQVVALSTSPAIGNQDLVAAPGAGYRLAIISLKAMVRTPGTDDSYSINEGPSGTTIFKIQARDRTSPIPKLSGNEPPWILPENTALIVNQTDATGRLMFTIRYYVERIAA